MATADLKSFIKDRLKAFDPAIDLQDGSLADVHLVQPLLAKLGTDPFETDIRAFAIARLKEVYPDLDPSAQGIEQLLVNPLSVFLEPFKREVEHVRLNQSLLDPTLLSDEEADALAANLFFSRDQGEKSKGKLDLHFPAVQSVTVDFSNVSTTATGLKFIPTSLQTITADALLLSQKEGLFVFSIDVEAEKEGDEYNVEAGAINGIEGVAGVVKVSNPFKMTGGKKRQSNTELKDAAENSVSERSFATARGIRARLQALFPQLLALQPIGYRDKEMERDIIKAALPTELGLGKVVAYGTAKLNEETTAESYALGVARKVQRLSGDTFASVVAAQTLTIKGKDRKVKSKTDNDNLVLDDFEVVTSGTGGSTGLGVSSPNIVTPDGAPLLYTNLFKQAAVDLLKKEVQAGHYLFVTVDAAIKKLKVVRIVSATDVVVDRDLEVISKGANAQVSDNVPASGDRLKVTVAGAKFQALGVKVGDSITLYRTTGAPPATNYWRRRKVATILSETEILMEADSGGAPVPSLASDYFFTIDRGNDLVLPAGSAGFPPATLSNVKWAVAKLGAGLLISDLFAPDAGPLEFIVRGKEALADVKLTLSDVPGGIVFPNTPQGKIEVPNDSIHIGGMTDIYAMPSDDDEKTLDVLDARGEVLTAGTDLKWTAADGPKGIVTADSLSGVVVSHNDVIVLETGLAKPTAFRVIGRSVSGNITLDTTTLPAVETTGVKYTHVASLKHKLHDVRRLRVSGKDLKTGVLSKTVQSVTTDFSAKGVLKGDRLTITKGANKGDYVVSEVKDKATLVLDKEMKVTAVDVEFEVYLTQASIERPFSRLLKLTLNDGGAEVGVVPYGKSVDVRSRGIAGAIEKLPNDTMPADNGTITVVDVAFDTGTLQSLSPTKFFTAGVVEGDFLEILDGVAIGSYTVKAVTTDGTLVFKPAPPQVVATAFKFRIGSRARGDVRVYFKDPTRAEFDKTTVFEDPDGRKYRVRPDISVVLLDKTDKTGDLVTTNGGPNVTSGTSNFLDVPVAVGDKLVVTTFMLDGLQITTPDALNVVAKTVEFTVEGQAKTTVVFQGTNPLKLSEPGVPGGVIEQLNAANPNVLWATSTIGPNKVINIHSPKKVTIGAGSAHADLKIDTLNNTSNQYAVPGTGTYEVKTVTSATALELTANVSQSSGAKIKFFIQRPQYSRTGAKKMKGQAEGGYFYADVPVESIGTGSAFNLAEGGKLTVTGEKVLGYTLSTAKSVLTYSTAEETDLVVTPTVPDPEKDDLAKNNFLVPLKTVRVAYERAPTIGSMQAIVLSDAERVVNDDPLARHFLPAVVNLELSYTGVPGKDVIEKELKDFFKLHKPSTNLEVFDIHAALAKKGATLADEPLEVRALVHAKDRQLSVFRSKSILLFGRAVHTIPGDIKVTKAA